MRGKHLACVGLVLTAIMLSDPALAQSSKSNNLQSLKVEETRDKTVISIESTAKPTFTVFKLTNPQRVFIDIVDGDISRVPVKHLVRNGVINDVSLIQYDTRN